jgi:UDP-3-O-[3-hydroxymyristoyl] glucosamine N-acyltransferase
MVNDAGAVVKKPQLLQVQIGNHVEIGANSCIDRGRFLLSSSEK